MASYRAERFIESALGSVLAQSLGDFEVIVCDDASTDGTTAIVRSVMRRDSRVRLVELAENGGPARARNRALDEARGEWVAIVDADDLVHPERFEQTLSAAHHFKADVIADDLLFFDEERGTVAHLLEGETFGRPIALTADLLLADRDEVPLGYLKPLMRKAMVDGLRYDESLTVGEDFDLLLRLLLAERKGGSSRRALRISIAATQHPLPIACRHGRSSG